jgi:hypothetical protein
LTRAQRVVVLRHRRCDGGIIVRNSRRLQPGIALPVIFQYREYALAGGLMSYGSSEGARDRISNRAAGARLRGN